ncbi:MAG TPA: hypothetical protein DDX54_05510 [Rhodospirillaceae bacterium]|nr:hypothetical protein [Rhodospirillaceae bacterium]
MSPPCLLTFVMRTISLLWSLKLPHDPPGHAGHLWVALAQQALHLLPFPPGHADLVVGHGPEGVVVHKRDVPRAHVGDHKGRAAAQLRVRLAVRPGAEVRGVLRPALGVYQVHGVVQAAKVRAHHHGHALRGQLQARGAVVQHGQIQVRGQGVGVDVPVAQDHHVVLDLCGDEVGKALHQVQRDLGPQFVRVRLDQKENVVRPAADLHRVGDPVRHVRMRRAAVVGHAQVHGDLAKGAHDFAPLGLGRFDAGKDRALPVRALHPGAVDGEHGLGLPPILLIVPIRGVPALKAVPAGQEGRADPGVKGQICHSNCMCELRSEV